MRSCRCTTTTTTSSSGPTSSPTTRRLHYIESWRTCSGARARRSPNGGPRTRSSTAPDRRHDFVNEPQRASDPVDLAGSLRALRARAGLSQTAVARATSISQAQLSRIETGAATPTTEQTVELARTYGTSTEERDQLIT